jgi:hypothetical protein
MSRASFSRARFAVLAPLALVACIEASDPGPVIDFGSVGLDINAASGGGYTATPIGFFTRGRLVSLPTTEPADRCQLLFYSSQQQFPPSIDYSDPGEGVQVTVATTTATLVPVQQASGLIAYTASPFAVTPGATANLVVPGTAGGFPAATASVRTAEPFTFDPVLVTEEPEGLPLSWTTDFPTGIVGQIMLVSLRYASGGGDDLDRQIYCELRDDGSFTVPADLAVGWGDAGVTVRTVNVQRVRKQIVQISGDVLEFGSTFDVTGTTFTPAATAASAAR